MTSTRISTTAGQNPYWGRWEFSLVQRVRLIALGWTLVVIGLLAFQLHDHYQRDLVKARAGADLSWARDMTYRHWVQKNGGVYVPASEETPPNPNLAHVAERDIVAPSGRTLTLVNFSYLQRQLMDLSNESMNVSKSTSLKPLNPRNAPTPKEAEGLRKFESGERNAIEWKEEADGRRYLRVMRPFIVEASCLKCHKAQGYVIGDVRGGVITTVSIPNLAEEVAAARYTITTYSILWFAGIVGLAAAFRSIKRKSQAQQRDAESLTFSNAILATQQEMSPDGILLVDEAGYIISYNRRFVDLWGVSHDLVKSAIDKPVLDFVASRVNNPQQFLEKISYLYEHPDENSKDEISLLDGRTFDRYSNPLTLPDGRYIGRLWSFRDITQGKRQEDELRAAARTDKLTGLPTEASSVICCNRPLSAPNASKTINSPSCSWTLTVSKASTTASATMSATSS